MINVLIVDDSAFARRSLCDILEKDKDIRVVATASNGEDALKLVKLHDPDVVTMDVEMPRMDGLTALSRIMAENPCPVMMVSSLTKEGAEVTLKALELGALDFMPKLNFSSQADLSQAGADLRAKIKALARRKAFIRLLHSRARTAGSPATAVSRGTVAHTATSHSTAAHGLTHPHAVSSASFATSGSAGTTAGVAGTASAAASYRRGGFEIVAIGVSTGGPPAVQKVLSALPANFPVPILIAQHMPAAFTGPFAQRLNAQCAIAVKEAEPVERLRAGTAYICPGGKHLRLENRGGTLTGIVTEEPKEALYKPSANVLMETVGLALGRKALGVILTGMGNDGLEGTKILKEKGGKAIAQSEATCVVYGMPKALVDAQLADEIVDIDNMAAAILESLAR